MWLLGRMFCGMVYISKKKIKATSKTLQLGGKWILIPNICLWAGRSWKMESTCMLLYMCASCSLMNDLAFNINVVPFNFNINTFINNFIF